MIRYILVDDDPKTLEHVKSKIDTLSKDYELHHVKSYNSSKEAVESANTVDFDLLIVDFEMPVYSGIEVAQRIGDEKKIIFLTSTTANEKQIINSLDISGYLSKPFDLEEFTEILKHKIIGKIKPQTTAYKKENITLHIGANKDLQFRPDHVYYISTSRNINGKQPNKNCVHIYGVQDEIAFKNVRMSINDLSEALKDFGFLKINQSTIINTAQIKMRDNTNILLHNTKETFKTAEKEKLGLIAKLRSAFRIKKL